MTTADPTLALVSRFTTQRFKTHRGGAARLQRMLEQHLATGGKRLRAKLPEAIVLAAGPAAPVGAAAAARVWGAAIELVHNGTLVHDDIQDGDELRRDEPTLWVRHGVAQAINAGDALLIGPLLAVLQAEEIPEPLRPRLAALLADAAMETIRGQVADIGWRDDDPGAATTPQTTAAGFDASDALEDLEAVFRAKTSPLFACALVGGLLILGHDEPARLRGGHALADGLGVAFQVRDDLLDLVGTKGRGSAGADLREGKLTWPVLAAMRSAPADSAAALRARLAEVADGATLSADEVNRWLGWVDDHGGIRAARAQLERTLARSRDLAREAFPPGAVDVVLDLCDRLARLDG
jgi:geranylgeranyl pyrophosphate synthase